MPYRFLFILFFLTLFACVPADDQPGSPDGGLVPDAETVDLEREEILRGYNQEVWDYTRERMSGEWWAQKRSCVAILRPSVRLTSSRKATRVSLMRRNDKRPELSGRLFYPSATKMAPSTMRALPTTVFQPTASLKKSAAKMTTNIAERRSTGATWEALPTLSAQK